MSVIWKKCKIWWPTNIKFLIECVTFCPNFGKSASPLPYNRPIYFSLSTIFRILRTPPQIWLLYQHYGKTNPIFWYKKMGQILFRLKVWSLISLCGLHRLIWDDTLRTCIMLSFLRTRHIYGHLVDYQRVIVWRSKDRANGLWCAIAYQR